MMRLLIAMLVVLGPSTQSNGRIAGHVSTTGDPGVRLARAYVSLIGTDSTTRRLTMTRSDGTFVFDDVPAGVYVVEAGRLPHLAKAERVTLKPGQLIDDVTFRLKRSGVIAGQVFDEQGQPARETRVSAQRIRYDRGGVTTTDPTGYSAVIDRFGRFRIHGLAPGAYVVATSPAVLPFATLRRLTDADLDRAVQGIIAPRPSAQGQMQPGAFELRMSPVFIPGVTSAGAATVFVIDDGTEHLNVIAHLVPAASLSMSALTSVTGSVVGPDGQPVNAQVTLNVGQPGLPSGAEYRRGSTGSRFAFEWLMPGPIRIGATVPGQNLRATANLTAAGGQISDVVLRLSPPVEITGRVTPVGPDAVSRMIVVKSLSGSIREAVTETAIESGQFRLSLYPGRYVIASGSSVTIDGRDMTDRVIEITPETTIKSLIVSFSEERQDITGRVINADGAGVDTVTMVAFSTNETDWFHQSRRIAVAEPSADGRYQLGGAAASLPAGDYYLAAMADLSPDEQYNPAFLRTLVDAAIRITLEPGQRVLQDVRVR